MAETSLNTIALGSQGLRVTELGYGCMGLTSFYGTKLSDDAVVDFLVTVFESGVRLWDTANLYIYPVPSSDPSKPPTFKCQEELIGRALERVGHENVVVATKSGSRIVPVPKPHTVPDGSPAFVRSECEASLRRLGVPCIDLFYLHRIDQKIPIEVTMLELKRLVDEGKIRYIGLSECSAATLRRAHKVHPVSAVQLEYSLWARDIEDELLPTCAELGVGVVAYAPLGRGFLSSAALLEQAGNKLGNTDYRRSLPRMQGEAAQKNAALVARVEEIAKKKGVSTAQLALAWVRSQQHRLKGAGVVAIPGTTKEKNLRSNVGSVEIELSEQDIADIEKAVPVDEVAGGRYTEGQETWQTDKNPPLSPEQAEELGLSV